MNIKTKLIPITWLNGLFSHGYACGYVGVPKDHPWFEMDYDDIHSKFDNVSVHGGLTFSSHTLNGETTPDIWWVGFDTAHGGDNKYNCDKTYCEAQVEQLKQQAIQCAS